MTEIEELLSRYTLVDKEEKVISDEQRKHLLSFSESLSKSQSVQFIYRGTNLLQEQYNVGKENIKALSEILFLAGYKGDLFLKKYNQETDFIGNVNELSFQIIWNKLHDKICNLSFESENTKEHVKEFLISNPSIYTYFGNFKNKDRFIRICSSSKSSTLIADYYFSMLHTIGKSAYGKSYFLSSSQDINVATQFYGNGIIIVGWFSNKILEANIMNPENLRDINQLISAERLPVYTIPVYPNQKEVCLKCGMLPHYILGYIADNNFIVNPDVFKHPYSEDIALYGLNVDQSNFKEELAKTNYRFGYSFCDGKYTPYLIL